VCGRLGIGLFNTANDLTADGDLARRDALLQELQDLANTYPDNEVLREVIGRL
jgi:hypothetical protein